MAYVIDTISVNSGLITALTLSTAPAAGGSTILDGAGPPTPAIGSTGDYYEDTTNGVLYGPKVASGFGPAQTLSISNSAASNTTGFEIGTRVRLARPGRITGARYSRSAPSASTLYLRVWNDSTGAKLAEVADTRAGASGDFTVSFPTPVTVGANEIVIVSVGGVSVADNVPYEAFGTGVATNTADITWLSWRAVNTVNSFPSGSTSHVGQVEPIYEPDQSWPISVRQTPYYSASVPGMVSASGGGTTNFLRADGTWSPAQPLDATLTALAGANWAANSLAVGSGTDTVAQVAFASNTFPARASTGNLVAKAISDFGLSLVAITTLTANGVLLGNGTSPITATSVGETGKVLSGVTGSTPLWLDPVTATGGTVNLALNHDITSASNVYEDVTGLSFTLPATPGTYLVTFTVRGVVTPASGPGTATITARLNLNGAGVTGTDTLVVIAYGNGVQAQASIAGVFRVVATGGGWVLKLQVKRNNATTYSASALAGGLGGDGGSSLAYVRIG